MSDALAMLDDTLISVRGLKKYFPIHAGWLNDAAAPVDHRVKLPLPRRLTLPDAAIAALLEARRGITHDLEFPRWANKVWDHSNSTGDWDSANQLVSLKDFRKDIVIEMYNEAGQKAVAYKVFRAWPSAYQAMPELDANGNAIAIQSMTIECEGWEQDYDTGEPTEGLFDLPPKA